MNIAEILFFVMAALTLLSGILTISSKKPVYSILFLIITFFSISGHYVLMNAQFLAVVNIIVYGGAIMVLFLFTVMLMNLNQTDKNFSKGFIILAGSLAALVFFIMTAGIFFQSDIESNMVLMSEGDIGLTEKLGSVLYADYVIPFELASILFMGAMIGAVLLSKKREEEKEELKNSSH
ncbi:MAG TPA: NADH-quinone oxidoreductase subunit J [Moheibacter sp.]|nr:NADH-quinone oxidoreductase subunit J [Moheibacter sp.]